jgi:protease-4
VTGPARPRALFGCLFTLSFLLNLVAAVVILLLGYFGSFFGGGADAALPEHRVAGQPAAVDKVAVIHLEGVILEGLLHYVHRQIDQAARDPHVKAVVLRINSPGGSITASDDLHRRLTELRDGNRVKGTEPKPLVVSMGSLAASGGYYVAMPARSLYAEPNTMTGSVGVYMTFPNVQEGLEKKLGVRMETIKQGEIKDSGSPFKVMTDKERQVWQDLVDHAYQQFLGVVEKGRPNLEGKLLKPFDVEPVRAGPRLTAGRAPGQEGDKGPKAGRPGLYQRYLADGGIFTADQAKERGLIDRIGYLEDAVQRAHDDAHLGPDYKVIEYQRPKSLVRSLLGISAPGDSRPHQTPAGTALDPGRLREALTPRLWYLAPGCELAGLLAPLEAEGRE